MIEYYVLQDGWIKVAAKDFLIGGPKKHRGRLLIGLNQLLVRIDGKTVLIDAGLGDKWLPQEVGLTDFEMPRKMPAALNSVGCSEADVDIVILTHLHFDHCGGAVQKKQDGSLALLFTNAVYYVQSLELEYALNPDPEREADYSKQDLDCLVNSGQMQVLDGDTKISDSISVFLAPGHSKGHQVVLIEKKQNGIFFPGDLIATQYHANNWMSMSYDLDANVNLRHRKIWLERAQLANWMCVFCHEVRRTTGFINTIK